MEEGDRMEDEEKMEEGERMEEGEWMEEMEGMEEGERMEEGRGWRRGRNLGKETRRKLTTDVGRVNTLVIYTHYRPSNVSFSYTLQTSQ